MKTVFIDRDGVVNKRLIDDWVKSWADFEVLEGVAEALAKLKKANFRCILVTNQRGVSLGLFDLNQLTEIHEKMNNYFRLNGGGYFDDIFVCHHDRHHNCKCRKPEPGLFFQAAEKYPDIDLEKCVMFGDSGSDGEAAKRAGCKSFYKIDEEHSLLNRVEEYLNSTNFEEVFQ